MVYQIADICNMISNDTPVSGPLSSFSCCGGGGRGPASYSGPKTSYSHRGVEQYDRRPLPSRTCLPSGTPHTEGGSAGTVSWPSAMLIRNL